jgi:hypothetical protein
MRPLASFLGTFCTCCLSLALLCCGGGNGNRGGGGAITANIAASPTTVDLGQIVKLTWSSTNATSCLATSAPAESDWTAIVATSGSATVTPESYAGEVYSLTCAGSESSSATASASVTINSAASGLSNGISTQTATTYWEGNSCILDGTIISNLTIASNNGIGVNPLALGNPQKDGGIPASWSPTGDGAGILITYGNLSCFRGLKVPVSVINITGSAASGSFDGELIDQDGVTAACTFVLVAATDGWFSESCD